MKLKILALLTCISIAITVVMVLNTSKIMASTNYKININLTDMMENIEKLNLNDPRKAMSSNPYDYIIDNQEYENIISLGLEALPVLKKNIIRK